MTRACVFCGATPLTREHIFPRWLAGILPTQERWRAQDLAIVEGDLIAAPKLPVTTRQMVERFTDATVVRVCKLCNNGWMNDLEESSRSTLTALVTGQPVHVQDEQAESLALWVAKTCVMAQLTHPESAATPLAHFRWIYEHRSPPPGMYIWALNIDTEDWGVRMQHYGILYGDPASHRFSEPCNMHSTTIGLGHVAFHVMSTTNQSVTLPSLDDIPPLDSIGLWPRPGQFEWGRTTPLDDTDVWTISDLLRLWLGDDDDQFLSALMGLGLRRM